MTTKNGGVGISANRAPRVPIQKSDAPDQPSGAPLSDGARSLAAARKAVEEAMDVREQRVAEIRQRLADGTYIVPSRVLARRMLGGTNA
jgi:flagellar biosynthesis anti-sigma factor FlgM